MTGHPPHPANLDPVYIIGFCVGTTSLICTIFTLLLIYVSKKWNGYLLLLTSMTIFQIFYDVNYILRIYNLSTVCWVTQFLDLLGGLGSNFWTNILAFVITYTLVTCSAIDIFYYYPYFSMFATFLPVCIAILALTLPDVYYVDDDGDADGKCSYRLSNTQSSFIYDCYYYGRLVSICISIVLCSITFWKIRRMSLNTTPIAITTYARHAITNKQLILKNNRAESSAILKTVKKMNYYAIAQIICRLGAAWNEANYGAYSCFPSKVLAALMSPSIGICNFLIFLFMQPNAWKNFKHMICGWWIRDDLLDSEFRPTNVTTTGAMTSHMHDTSGGQANKTTEGRSNHRSSNRMSYRFTIEDFENDSMYSLDKALDARFNSYMLHPATSGAGQGHDSMTGMNPLHTGSNTGSNTGSLHMKPMRRMSGFGTRSTLDTVDGTGNSTGNGAGNERGGSWLGNTGRDSWRRSWFARTSLNTNVVTNPLRSSTTTTGTTTGTTTTGMTTTAAGGVVANTQEEIAQRHRMDSEGGETTLSYATGATGVTGMTSAHATVHTAYRHGMVGGGRRAVEEEEEEGDSRDTNSVAASSYPTITTLNTGNDGGYSTYSTYSTGSSVNHSVSHSYHTRTTSAEQEEDQEVLQHSHPSHSHSHSHSHYPSLNSVNLSYLVGLLPSLSLPLPPTGSEGSSVHSLSYPPPGTTPGTTGTLSGHSLQGISQATTGTVGIPSSSTGIPSSSTGIPSSSNSTGSSTGNISTGSSMSGSGYATHSMPFALSLSPPVSSYLHTHPHHPSTTTPMRHAPSHTTSNSTSGTTSNTGGGGQVNEVEMMSPGSSAGASSVSSTQVGMGSTFSSPIRPIAYPRSGGGGADTSPQPPISAVRERRRSSRKTTTTTGTTGTTGTGNEEEEGFPEEDENDDNGLLFDEEEYGNDHNLFTDAVRSISYDDPSLRY